MNENKKINPICDYNKESNLFFKRIIISSIIILILMSILIFNIYCLQIIHYKDYKTKSDDNRIKLLPVQPSRGIIYDRNSVPLALNKIFYQLEIIPEKTNNLEKIFKELHDIIDLNKNDIKNFKKKQKKAKKFTPIPIKSSLNEIQIARFAVNQYRFPQIKIKGCPQRYYPFGSTLTHVIGYVGEINNKDVKYLENNGLLKNYLATHSIGKLGIEKYYENILHGKIGYEEVEVDSHGKIIRRLTKKDPEDGKDIFLTIDLNLQIKIEKLLINNRGAAIVIDPRNEEILALVSTPSYNPNLFVKGISKKDYRKLINNPNRPLVNRTTQGIYPPASTVKPFLAIAALSDKIINTNSIIFDPGWWKIPNSKKYYRDWRKLGHGKINILKAIIESADTFFYYLSYKMGIDRISHWMKKFGYGQITGIDINEEKSGIIPTKEWKQKKYKKPWYLGDTIAIGIGQGYWTCTPIQMAKALMTLINNGKIKTPHLLYGIKNGNKIKPYQKKEYFKIQNIHLNFWKLVRKGMYGVANCPNGTAYKSFTNSLYKAAVKSGTAQVFSYQTYNSNKLAEHLRDHKLMIGFAPYNKPIVSVTVVLENEGKGRISIGDLVRNIFDYILIDKKKPFYE